MMRLFACVAYACVLLGYVYASPVAQPVANPGPIPQIFVDMNVTRIENLEFYETRVDDNKKTKELRNSTSTREDMLSDINQLISNDDTTNDVTDPPFLTDRFQNVEDIYGFMKTLQQKRPEVVKIIDVGNSSEGRPIKLMKISDSTNHSAFWVDGGIHAGEWISISSVCYLMNVLVTRWHVLKPKYKNFDYYLLPVVNPDGYQFSLNEKNETWIKNRRHFNNTPCIGVNLNHNFPFDRNTSRKNDTNDPCSNGYRGDKPLSEPESKSMADFLTLNSQKIKGYITLHHYARCISYPYWQDTTISKNASKELNYVASRAMNLIKNITNDIFDVSEAHSCTDSAEGASLDWVYRDLNISVSYMVELRRKTAFTSKPIDIIPSGKNILIILLTLVDSTYMNANEKSVIPDVPENIVFRRPEDYKNK